jgi:hypothetical protein
MRPSEMNHPGAGRRTGAAGKCETFLFYNKIFQENQAVSRLTLLLIGPTFEPELSLHLDAAHIALEEMPRGGPVHIGVVVKEVMADMARQRGGAG